MRVIIVSPSLDVKDNVSGISAVTRFIIKNNPLHEYIHFEVGKKDNEKGGIRRISSLAKSLIKWVRLLRQEKDAVIHYNFPLSAPSIVRDPFFIFAAKFLGKRMVIHVHGGVYLSAPQIPFFLNTIMKAVFRLKLPFIVLSSLECDILKDRYGVQKVYSLPNCVDLSEAEKFTRPLVPDSEPVRFGYLGRIAETKGMTYLLNACKTLKQDGCHFVMSLAGKEENAGEYLDEFSQQLGDSFAYAGVVSGASKDQFLRSVDVFVLPSFFEGLPISLIECMSFESAVITTPVGSIPELVTDTQNGLFIPVKDEESLVRAMKRLCTDHHALQELGKAAKKTIFEQFSVLRYMEQLNKYYDETKN